MRDISEWNFNILGKNYYCLIIICYFDDFKKKYIILIKNRLCLLDKFFMFNVVFYNICVKIINE